ncbi:MAG: DUF5021 domain-containing protein [Oscillospiraceae bacterium]
MKMSKKILCSIALAAMLLTLTACGNQSEQSSAGSSVVDGYDLQSKITSADILASEIKTQAKEFLIKADNDGHALKGTEELAVLGCRVDDGKWNVSVSDNIQFGENGDKWRWTGDDKSSCFDSFMADVMSDFKQGYVEIYIKYGNIIGVATVNSGSSSDIPEALRDENTWSDSGEINWQGGKAGVGENGVVIGTSPRIAQKGN